MDCAQGENDANNILLALTVATAMVAAPTVAQGSSWRTIAFKTVSGEVDIGRINVRGDVRYREVRLCAFNAPLRMRDFDIRFENNQRQDVRVRHEPIYRGYTRPVVRIQAR